METGGITLEVLRKLFVGQKIAITEIKAGNVSNLDHSVCQKIISDKERANFFHFEFANGGHYGFYAETITGDFAEGSSPGIIGDKLVLKIVKADSDLVGRIKAAFPDENGLYDAIDGSEPRAIGTMIMLTGMKLKPAGIVNAIKSGKQADVLLDAEAAVLRDNLATEYTNFILQQWQPATGEVK